MGGCELLPCRGDWTSWKKQSPAKSDVSLFLGRETLEAAKGVFSCTYWDSIGHLFSCRGVYHSPGDKAVFSDCPCVSPKCKAGRLKQCKYSSKTTDGNMTYTAAKNGGKMREEPCWVKRATSVAQPVVFGQESGSRKASCKHLNVLQGLCRGLQQPQGVLPRRRALRGGHIFMGGVCGSWNTVNLHCFSSALCTGLKKKSVFSQGLEQFYSGKKKKKRKISKSLCQFLHNKPGKSMAWAGRKGQNLLQIESWCQLSSSFRKAGTMALN